MFSSAARYLYEFMNKYDTTHQLVTKNDYNLIDLA